MMSPAVLLTLRPNAMVGRTVSHYQILGELGAGGMGVVYSAVDSRLGRPVALKFVSHDLSNDEQAILRLRSEARAASALNHSNICTIYDIGEDAGRPFIVMELIKGQTLRERLTTGPLKVHQVVDAGIEIADALHAAHSSGIIHRDIKPGNIFLSDSGHVKVLDFGLAKLTPTLMGSATTAHSPDPTAAGVMLGTTAYMSPEQVNGEQLDGRTDLFSLGVVLYEAAAGHHPFPGKTSAAIVGAILERAPVPLPIELPLRLQEVINNCLEKDRELRYQSAADLRADLKRVRRDLESGLSRRSGVLGADRSSRSSSEASAVSGPVTASEIAPAPKPLPSGPRQLPRLAVVAVALTMLTLAAIGAYFFTQDEITQGDAGAETAATRARIDSRLLLAQASYDAKNYRAALAYATEVLTLAPQHDAALKIRNQAEAMVIRFDAAILDARSRIAAGDIAGAARALDIARDLDPASPTVIELASQLANDSRRKTADARTDSRVPPVAAKGQPAAEAKSSPPATTPQPPSVPPAASVVLPPPPAAAAPAPAPAPEPIAPPVPTPPPPAPPQVDTRANAPPPSSSENDEAAIRQLVAAYARAIEGKDLALFRSIKPNLSREEERRLQDGFRAVSSQRVNLTVVSIDTAGDTATVVVNRRDIIRVGARDQTSESRQTLRLTRVGAGWGIVEIR